jgi:hypothetical protein
MGNLFVNLPVPTSNADGAAVDVSAMGATKTIIVGGPFQGTVTIEYSNDDGAAVWAPVPNSSFVNQPGRVTIDLAVKWMRAVMDAYKGGSANADVGAPAALASFAAISVAPVDISAMSSFKTVVSPAANLVEISEDGTSWSQAFSFQNGGGQSAVVVGRLARCLTGMVWMGGAPTGDGPGGVPLPPFAVTEIVIFANQDGSDETGAGTEANPYRTFQRAVRDVPAVILPGFRYKIEITNLGDETFPAEYALPAWSMWSEDDVFINANQQPANSLTPAERTVTVTSAIALAITKTISVTDTSQNWAPGSLKGLFLSVGDPFDPLISVIYDNTNDTLLVTGNDSSPVVPSPGDVLTITEPSARFITTGDFGFRVSDSSLISIFGVKMEPGPDSFGTLDAGNATMKTERCVFVQPYYGSAAVQHHVVSCYIIEGFFESRLYLSRGLLQDSGVRPFVRPAQTGLSIHSGQVLENTCVQIDNGITDRSVGGLLTMSGVLIKDPPSDGVKLVGGASFISGVEVDGAQGDAFAFIGPGKHTLQSIVGTGSTGVGIRSDDGAQVELQTLKGTGDSLAFFNDPDDGPLVVLTDVGAGFDTLPSPQNIVIAGATTPANNGTFEVLAVLDPDNIVFRNPAGVTEVYAGNWTVDPVTVTGAFDQQVGSLAAGAYPAIPFNIVDVYTGANPNIVGTGARLFNK